MKKVLFIVPYPTGEAPSQRFRFEQYFEILKNNHFQYIIKPFWSVRAWQVLYRPGYYFAKTGYFFIGVIKRFILLFSMRKYQFIFIHREAMPLGPPVIELLTGKILKKKIIYDFDDAIWLPNTSKQNRFVSWLKWHGKVNTICRLSWKVSCGNDVLADYAGKFNENVVVNPTTIDTDYHKPLTDSKNNPPVIGWTGTHSTAKYLALLTPALKELKKNHEFSIKIICDQPPAWDYEDFEFVSWQKEKEIEQLNSIDIGIMPLENTEWEKGKCGFKALQYMALEKPAVVSDVGVNREITDHGKTGFLCSSIEDWVDHLSALLKSETLRKELGKNGREKVIQNYSVDSNASLFLSLFE